MIAWTFQQLDVNQQLQAFQIWHDGTDPAQYIYELDKDRIVGRASLSPDPRSVRYGEFERMPMPGLDVVKAALQRPARVSTRDVLHELPASIRPPQLSGRGVTGTRRRETRKPAPIVSKPKPRARKYRSPYTRADWMRGVFLLIMIAVLAITYGR